MSRPPGRKRVAFFTEVGLIGGAERFLRDVVHSLDPDRYEVEVVCVGNTALPSYLREHAVAREVAVRSLALRTLGTNFGVVGARSLKRVPLLYRWRSIPKGLLRQTKNLRNWPIIVRALRDRRIDILHINNGGYPGGESCRLAAVAARQVGIPVRVMTVHNMAETVTFPKRLERSRDVQIAAALDVVVTGSQASARSLLEVRGFPSGKLQVIPYGIPDPGIGSRDRLASLKAELGIVGPGVVIGVVGSFEPRKGQEVLIRTLPAIKARLGALKAIFVGEGERLAAAQALSHELGVAGDVIFAGYRRDALEIMRLLDVLALPSVGQESLPYVVIEAMALGKPVVGSRIAGVPEEIEDGVTGKLVAPGDSAALAEALIGLLLDRDRASEMGRQGRRKYLAEFTLSRMMTQLERMYEAGRCAPALT